MLLDLLVLDASAPLRAGLAAGAAFLTVAVLGRPWIGWLARQGVRDGASVKGADKLQRLHAAAGKARTPTMGGVLFLAAFTAAAFVAAPLDVPAVWVALGLVLAFGAIGLADDWAKLTKRARGKDGMSGRTKLLLEVALSATALLMIAALDPRWALASGTIDLPLGAALDLGAFAIVLGVVAIVGTANAANFTDGLDGLATGVVGVAAASLTVATLLSVPLIGLLIGDAHAAGAIIQPTAAATSLPVPDTSGLWLSAALAGGCLGFLLHNAHPARVFMGDTGSLAIGSALGMAAVVAGREALLVVVAGVPVVEILSVIAQVGVFKLTGRRILRCAPIHHHFQFLGWSERRIVRTFWTAGLLCALVGLTLIA